MPRNFCSACGASDHTTLDCTELDSKTEQPVYYAFTRQVESKGINDTILLPGDGAQAPRGFVFRGIATRKEVKGYLDAQLAKQQQREAREQFEVRVDVKLARQVHMTLELQLDEVVDRLTPTEWQTLLAKLEGR